MEAASDGSRDGGGTVRGILCGACLCGGCGRLHRIQPERQYSDIRDETCEEAVNFLSEAQILAADMRTDGTFRPDGQDYPRGGGEDVAVLLTESDAALLLPESAAERLPQEEEGSADGKTEDDSGNEAEKYAQQLAVSMGEESSMRELALSLYDDLENSVWAQPYIAASSLCGIVNGYGDRIFRPQGNITYNELAAICVRAAGISARELTGSWPDNYVRAADKLGIYEGMKEFDPETGDGSEAASRGNTAIAVYHAYEKIQEPGAGAATRFRRR